MFRPAGGQDAVDESIRAAAVRVAQVVVSAVARGRGQVEALVEHVAACQRGADEIPGQAEESRPLLGAGVVRAVQELVEERAQPPVLQLPALIQLSSRSLMLRFNQKSWRNFRRDQGGQRGNL